ncbi:limonoid 7-O-acetyltransferse-like [Silene latifolia]|uniref:limonoid 7-O-acetyltransferse-like n=1 Tax=Silene latifolia TaxID=37657 RepID=UPI003D781512
MELAMEMEQISMEMIKPLTPTLPHLKSYQFSLFDQLLSFSEYGSPLALFYASPRHCNNDESITNTVTRLKESLSKTLSQFYPLAGRLFSQDSTIICNDEGNPLVVARANCTLFSFLTAPNRVELVPRFIPRDDIYLDPTRIDVDGLIIAAFQITVFSCGGFVVGSNGNTKAVDGTTRAHFFMAWAANATSGDPQFGDPNLTNPTPIFPPVPSEYVTSSGIPPVLKPVEDGSSSCVVQAFVFSPASISALQAKARSDFVPNPTRVEAVTCFLWKHMMKAASTVVATIQSSSSSIARQERVPTTTSIIHSVNIRPHLRPMLPPTYFGKLVAHAIADSENKEGSTPTIRDLVVSLRQGLTKIRDNEWLNKFRGEGRLKAACEVKKTLEKFLPKSYYFTSLSGFDQVNFGSGAPLWIGFTGGRTNSFFRNYVPLIHTSDQIEAWPVLDEKEMEALLSDQEFLAVAIPSHVAPLTFLPKASL